MQNAIKFKIFADFFTKHPDVHKDKLLELADTIQYYKQLNGKMLDDICVYELQTAVSSHVRNRDITIRHLSGRCSPNNDYLKIHTCY